ncbi:MAG TPA: YbjN domain-containing protein [Armatimonadota bacterium]|nr:YbjN domain-containing protein [Armatimonadota bacterium]
MAEVEPFNRAMIEKFLKANDVEYEVDEDGDLILETEADSDTGWELNIYLIVEGDAKEIFTIRGFLDPEVPSEQWDEAAHLCNTWNSTTYWPKAYLGILDREKDTTGVLVLERQIDLEAGIHTGLFESYASQAIDGMYEFLNWAPREIQLPAEEPPDEIVEDE